MATYTGNLNLKKPDQSDKIRIADFNGNSDAIDAAIGGDFGVGSNPSIDDAVNSMGEGLAIISNGNTHAAITSGKYVYIRGHGTLAEGLYVATASIAQNGTLSLNNVSAVSGGGLNALNSKLTNVDRAKIVFVSATITIPSIAANSYASANVDVDIPADTYGIKTIVPRYTSIGVPVAGAYGTTGAPTGKQRITVGVYNVTGAAQSNVTATVDVGFMY